MALNWFFIAARINYRKPWGLTRHGFIITQFCGSDFPIWCGWGWSLCYSFMRLKQRVGRLDSFGNKPSRLSEVAGCIKFLAAVGLRSPCPSWLSSRGPSLLEALAHCYSHSFSYSPCDPPSATGGRVSHSSYGISLACAITLGLLDSSGLSLLYSL